MPESSASTRLVPLSRAHALALHREMLRIRRFEERCAELYSAGKIRGFLHLYIGEEAIAVGAMGALSPEDNVLATYREHGHALARGLPMDRVMAEMYGKVDGCSRGRGGSMHLFDVSHRFFGGNAIVGGHLPLAVGFGLADTVRHRDAVTACFFGEGAMAEGEFHESMNLAALWKLPVLFLCENNLYAMGTALSRSEAEVDLTRKAAAYGVHAEQVDGMDVLACEAAVRRAAAAAREGGGPRFIEFRTYRFRAHSMFDAQLYRDKGEVEAWRARDPLVVFEAALRNEGWIDDDAIGALDMEIMKEVDQAVAFAEASPWEPVETLTQDVTTPRTPCPPPPERTAGKTNVREALGDAIREALDAMPEAFLMGEDVGRYGGCYAVSKGLYADYGPERIRDTPLSESAFVGAGIGAALGGVRPIVEVMTVNFSMLALDQVLNNAATLRHMSGGQVNVPVVIRMAYGAGRQLAAQHSHSLEGWYAHIPGLRVLAPGTIEDARGMLWSALHEPDPVILFEHVNLYAVEGDPGIVGAVDLDHAAVRRSGRDVTIVAWGGTLPKALEAATALAGEGIEAEVIDLRVLRPLDESTLLTSVTRTRRLVIVDEAWRTGGWSAEIAALVAERAFWELDAPIERVCTIEVPIPYPRHLEQAALPQVDGVIAACRRAVRGTDA